MSKKCYEPQTGSDLFQFYDGKSIFLTGAAGYLGSVLLETLLRCFPGIEKVYILLRKKKDKEPLERKNIIFRKNIFKNLLKDKPDIADKVHVVAGEIIQPNLGLSNGDTAKILEDVTIVFHCAATVSFTKTLKSTAIQNVIGTNNMIELCRKLYKLDVLVYTSTAYCNCNRRYIEEQVYRLPFHATRFLHELQRDNADSFEDLVSQCKPDWPNSYTFTKCLAENLLQDTASDLPIVIVRPSIITCAWKGNLPGYTEEGNGIVDFVISIARGFLRVTRGSENERIDLIPIDIVANTHVAAAWDTATKRTSSPAVINCAGGHVWPVAFGDYCKTVVKFGKKHTLPGSFATPSIKVLDNSFLYWMYSIYEHYIPAFFIDQVLRIKGKNPRMMKSYLFFDSIVGNMTFFTSTTIKFGVEKFNLLEKQIDPKDKELIYMDFEGANAWDILIKTLNSCTFGEWERDKETPEKRKAIVLSHSRLIKFLKRIVLFLMCGLLYLIVVKIFF